ncbi:MAG: AAA family ATPase [Candidatus Latescibacteria bacterium]|nr:AAA family ATPase [Candidatus Latescibacterota bacterium]
MVADSYIPQAQLAQLERLVAPGKVAVVYGPRRVGKTTLIRRYIHQYAPDALLVTGEDIAVRDYLESQSLDKLRAFVGQRRTLIVDEAQYVRQIGLNLKLLADHVEGLRIIATGSSSFDLAQQTGEPLTGRKYTLLLLPLAQLELQAVETAHETRARLETRLLYGSYPEVVLMQSDQERQLYLKELISSYLFKDILQLEGIRHADKLLRLLQLLAFQIGREVSVTELGGQLGMNKNTAERYLDLLEKTYVIYSRRGFSRNLRKEITKSRRYYFYDNGIRNGLVNNFNPLALRDDVGALWENYVLAERLKSNLYNSRLSESYFWRTYDQQEIDLIEEWGGQLHTAEMKWSPQAVRPPKGWSRAYPDSSFQVVHRDNYLDFIAG